MKRKDYVRLSKISLKARKKTTRGTVRGISFGLILLLPLLFIVIAFHLDLNKEVNKDASIRVFNIDFTKEKYDDSYAESILDEYSENIYNIKGVKNVIKYNQYYFENEKSEFDNSVARMTVILDGKSIKLDYGIDELDEHGVNIYKKVGVTAIDTSVGNSVFIKADSEVSDNPLVGGKEFSTDSSGEIMVSSNFLSHYDLEKEDVLNKKITITYQLPYGYSITDSKDKVNYTSLEIYNDMTITLLKEFEVVGIYNSDIYKSSSRYDMVLERYFSENLHDTYFWITLDSLTNVNGNSYLPEYISVESEMGTFDEQVYYYSSNPLDMSKNAILNNKAFFPLGYGTEDASIKHTNNVYKSLIEFEEYDDANNAVSLINSYYKKTSTSTEDINVTRSYMNETFENYRMFYNVFTYACIVLAIFGGVVFFATLLNLYNTIHFSVQSRKNYLGMIRAIGMKGKEVTKLYFTEIFQVFKRAYIWSAIFGGGICIGICVLFKKIMSSDVAQIITLDLSLNPIYILVAFIALIIVNTIISVIFSLVACNNVSKKPVLEVLVENR